MRMTTFLWFDTDAEEAAEFYVSIFPDSRITSVARRPKNVPGETGGAMLVCFELCGQKFMAMGGGPSQKFNQAVSIMVHCETQEEIDRIWEKLTDGGEEIQCGWLKDRYGLSWQIDPESIETMLTAGGPEATERVMEAVMGMVKLDMAELQKAYEGG
ncbi:MAG: VOC family protein [bacterium]|jgi:predicted 3-demethylubiquinone-9 3-methyltransferase (glyoxalase superfamily)